ncbi:MAG: tRNA (guanosine(46)-N7)-methyltransferase TrmB [Treponema sp.]|nr:tRNA (guanosine(46)-N7)-methyltransferase TrmB [Treponema sp.]
MNEENLTAKNDEPLPEGLQKENIIRREVKTYVLRIGRMTDAQERSYNELSPVWCIPFENKKLNFVDIFGNTNPIIIEIGFGMGDVTAKLAQENPNINYIGIEVHKPGVGKLLSEIKKRDLKNLYIIEHDALEVLEQMIGDNSVNGFHIFFPDPWPKKRHHKRRLLQRPRTNLLAQKLAPEGYLYFVTDWFEYAEFALEELNQTENLENKYDGFAEPQEWRGQTKFERKGLNAERSITEIFFVKK